MNHTWFSLIVLLLRKNIIDLLLTLFKRSSVVLNSLFYNINKLLENEITGQTLVEYEADDTMADEHQLFGQFGALGSHEFQGGVVLHVTATPYQIHPHTKYTIPSELYSGLE